MGPYCFYDSKQIATLNISSSFMFSRVLLGKRILFGKSCFLTYSRDALDLRVLELQGAM
jgi:hypothetical protein